MKHLFGAGVPIWSGTWHKQQLRQKRSPPAQYLQPPPDIAAYKAVSAEYNLTSLSTFRACLFTMAVAALVWMSIGYILAR